MCLFQVHVGGRKLDAVPGSAQGRDVRGGSPDQSRAVRQDNR